MRNFFAYAEDAASRYDTDPRIKGFIDNSNRLEESVQIFNIDGLLNDEETEASGLQIHSLVENVLAASAGCKQTTISDVGHPVQEMNSEALQHITELCGRDRFTSSVLENESYVVRVNKSCHEHEVRRSNTKFDRFSDIIVMDKEDGRVFRFEMMCELVRDNPYFRDERLTLEENDEVLEMFRDLYKGDGKGGISDRVCENMRNSEESYRNFVSMVLEDEEFSKIYHRVGGITVCRDDEDGSDIGRK